ncbi:hypothetical protein H4R21_000828 [Coemansia helicoidea]|uniref:Uncharacterized protein n=1 Tax=Coemansia helicoidea TaxID=1286919 RepID=A0ACC1LEH8_9FUNG|nr:hypothetical protein H4R21_000828 [Coemansia helicoidea]
MLLCNLPEDILAIVLRKYIGFSYSPFVGFKCNLPLLAVCRQWRRLAIPSVYGRHALVTYGTRPDYGNGLFNLDLNAEEPANVDVVTNLDLIAMVGCARAVRRVYIDVFCLVNPFPGWHEVIQRMRAVAKEWRVEELTITIGPDSRHYDDDSVDMAEYTDDIVEVADALVALMPDVRRLNRHEANRSQISNSLYGRLASHYADQMEWFDTRYPIAVPPGFQFTSLKKAVMGYNDVADYQLPQMAIGELVDLSLYSGPVNHSWASFSGNSDSQVIEFPKLNRLSVEYSTVHFGDGIAARHSDGHRWRLRFPNLKTLIIHNTQRICPLLEYAVLPPRMESISIRMRSDSFQDIANVMLPATRYLSLHITPESLGDPSGLPAINRILENARGSAVRWLIIEDKWLPVVPEDITCTSLTLLAISALTGVDTMLALIKKLPNLARLALLNLDLSDIQADISIPEADEDAVVAPLRTSLTSLVMNCDTGRHSPDMAVAVVKYMLVAIPTLVEINTRRTPKNPVVQFVEAYAPRYPHLRTRGLKDNLPLLAVCRLWRRLAIPLVYSRAFVQYKDGMQDDDDDGDVSDDDVSDDSPDVEGPTDVTVKTNLGLVAMAGCARTVKRVHIDVRFLANPLPGWREVIQRMRAVAREWRAVELIIAMNPDSSHSDSDSVDETEYADDIAEVGDALAALVPGIDPNPIARSLYGRLASHYADQLEWLDSEHPIPLPPDCQFTRLRKVAINCEFEDDYQLPQMAVGELVKMSLDNASANHSWASFSSDSSSQTIEFPKLRQLYAGYHAGYLESGTSGGHRDGHPWRLLFPNLKRLNISAQENCPLLEYAVLPPRMEYISIQAVSSSYRGIANLVLPVTKRLYLGVAIGSHGDTSGLPAINRILESARGSESLELNIEDPLLRVVPESITCTALTLLVVSAPSSVDTMLAFIERLPNLVSLSLINLHLSGIQADISIPEADEDTAVEPLSMSLESLAIIYDAELYLPEAAEAVAKYLLLSIPTLTHVFAMPTPSYEVLDFVEAYAPRYPRLKGVKLDLY